MLPALPNIIRWQLEGKPSEGPSFEAAMVRRCYRLTGSSCCWIDAVQHLQLAHPLMERCTIGFARINPSDAEAVKADTLVEVILDYYLLLNKPEESEAALRFRLWDKLLYRFLVEGPDYFLHLEPEFKVQRVLKIKSERKIDLAATTKKCDFPVLFVEMAKDPVPGGFQHKDFAKMSSLMALSCASICRILVEERKDVSLVRIYGMWVGGTQVHFCITHPIVRPGPDGVKEVSHIFSAPDHWAVDIIDPTGLNQTAPPCELSCCNSDGIVLIPACGTWADHPDQVPIQADQLADSDGEDYVFTEQPSVTTETAPLNASSLDLPNVDYLALAKIQHFCNLAKSSAAQLNDTLREPPGPPPSSPEERTRAVVATQEDTLKSRSKHEAPSPRKVLVVNPQFTASVQEAATDMAIGDKFLSTVYDGIDHLFVKRAREVSRETIAFERMSGNILAPTLHHCHVFENIPDWCVLELESMEDFSSMDARDCDFIKVGYSVNLVIFEAVACCIHTPCGLYMLHHSAGLIHSNITNMTVMYSREDQLWKLDDYRQAMPIAESLATQRMIDSENKYLAPEVVASGVFTTASDVYALGKSLQDLWFVDLNISLFCNGDGVKDSKSLYRLFHPMIKRMKDEDPLKRPTVLEALKFFYLNYVERGPDFKKFEKFQFKSWDKIFRLVEQILSHDELHKIEVVPSSSEAKLGQDPEAAKENRIPSAQRDPSLKDIQQAFAQIKVESEKAPMVQELTAHVSETFSEQVQRAQQPF